jgi:broad specificity phosphatase PhoE
VKRTMLALLLPALLLAAAPAAAQAPPTVVILVRHGEKVTANRNDSDPVLTPAGQARAQALAQALDTTHLNAVITTQYRRSVATAAPVAAAHHLTPEVVDVHAGNGVQRVVNSIRNRHAGQTVLVVGHTNTVPEIIAALGGPHMADLPDWQYSGMYVLVLNAGRPPTLVRAWYGAPDAGRTASAPAAMRP